MLSGGLAYGVFNGYLHKVNAGTGAVAWRIAPDDTFTTLPFDRGLRRPGAAQWCHVRLGQ
jgi:hypothetical protein